MKHLFLVVAPLSLLLIELAPAAEPAPPAGFRALFNGRDLAGWYGLNPHSVVKLEAEKREASLKKMREEFPQHWRVDAGELVNIGTLLAFTIVCAAVLIMRRTNPQAERPFRVPLMPWVPLAGIATCLMLMFSLPVENWLRLAIWLVIGLGVYIFYGRHHSHLGRELRGELAAHGISPAGMPVPGEKK